MESLKDSNVSVIGVYGMGGVGKTTLAKLVEKKVLEDKLFDEVLMAKVAQNPDLKTIQDKFARDLGLTFPLEENAFQRVDRLHRRLKEKRVLVILDNIWAELELNKIGIPLEDDESEGKDVQRRCTVLLTSRDQHVLLNGMNCQKNFPVEVLSDEEARILFQGTVDDHSLETSDFLKSVDEIVRKCGGLSVAIETIAGALKNKSSDVWEDALNQLKNSDTRRIRGVEANVCSCIKFSYDFLDKETKSLFQLCALQKDGSGIPINDLMMHVTGSGWFQNFNRLKEARTRVQVITCIQNKCQRLVKGLIDRWFVDYTAGISWRLTCVIRVFMLGPKTHITVISLIRSEPRIY